MRTIYITAAALLFACVQGSAQVISIGSGASVTVQSGAALSADGLTLTPSADFTLSNTSLSKNSSVTNSSANPSINRVYKFSNTTGAFSGVLRIDYSEAELNGLNEAQLQVNVHNGSGWQRFTSATNNTTDNYVVSNSISAVALNEVTLASSLSPLPLVWLSFTVHKQNNHALLNWSTGSEQNTKDFVVQHSTGNHTWQSLGTVHAAGNSSTARRYSNTHTTPNQGINYYRILQRDLDNKYSYSEIRTLVIDNLNQGLHVIGNPVVNGILQVQLNDRHRGQMSFYSNDGKLLLQKTLVPGINSIDVSRFAKGVYWLRFGDLSEKVVLE